MYERLLRRAGAPLDIAERRVLFLASDSDIDDDILSTEAQEDLKTVLSPTPVEQPAVFPGGDHQQLPKEDFRRVPLYSPEQLLVEGEPILVRGENSLPPKNGEISVSVHKPTLSTTMTMRRRIEEFLRFAKELAELGAKQQSESGEIQETDPLTEYLDAIAVYVSPKKLGEDDDADASAEAGEGAYRVLPTVRMVYGATKPEVRERLMLAFNSPLFGKHSRQFGFVFGGEKQRRRDKDVSTQKGKRLVSAATVVFVADHRQSPVPAIGYRRRQPSLHALYVLKHRGIGEIGRLSLYLRSQPGADGGLLFSGEAVDVTRFGPLPEKQDASE
jgi:hypothetical protein